jgi:hypothetical protein
MNRRTSKNITSALIFFGFLFVLILLVPRISNASEQYLTGNWNSWLYWDGCIGGWAQETYMQPSSTIESYQINSNNQIIINQWGWQDNGWSPYTEYAFYQVLQVPGTSGTNVGVQVHSIAGGPQMWSYTGPTASYYIGTASGKAISYYSTDAGGDANEVGWSIYNPSGTLLLESYEPLPTDWEGYNLQNPVMYYQNTFVGTAQNPGGIYSTVDFVSGAGQFTYYNLYDNGMYVSQSNACIDSLTAENSEMQYSTISCGSSDCTQNFNAATGYEGHSTLGVKSFSVTFGGGWGFTTSGVQQGDLLIATEGPQTGE